MTLTSFVESVPRPTHRFAVVSRERGPEEALLDSVFEGEAIPVEARPDLAEEVEDDAVVLLDESGEPVTASPFSALYDAVLSVNSDLFVTGARGLEDVELPAVVSSLADVRFLLRGYPLAHKEKFLLILLSRVVEQRAWRAGEGTLRAAFQRLSRLDDEIGTRTVYERLAATGLDLHVYGRPDSVPASPEMTVHAGTSEEYRDGWFVIYRPPPGASADPAAIVAVETDHRVWDGTFTFDPERVAAVDDYVASSL